MLVRLLRSVRVQHKAGEILEVSDPAVLNFLFSTDSAVALRTAAPETPEDQMEAPEAKAEPKKTTARKRKA